MVKKPCDRINTDQGSRHQWCCVIYTQQRMLVPLQTEHGQTHKATSDRWTASHMSRRDDPNWSDQRTERHKWSLMFGLKLLCGDYKFPEASSQIPVIVWQNVPLQSDCRPEWSDEQSRKLDWDFALYWWGILSLVISTNYLVTNRVVLFREEQQHYFKAKCFWLFRLWYKNNSLSWA